MADETLAQVAARRGERRTHDLMERMGAVLQQASDGLEDCGDHAVLNSTNDADAIKTLAAEWFEFRYLHVCEFEFSLCKHCGRPDHDGTA